MEWSSTRLIPWLVHLTAQVTGRHVPLDVLVHSRPVVGFREGIVCLVHPKVPTDIAIVGLGQK